MSYAQLKWVPLLEWSDHKANGWREVLLADGMFYGVAMLMVSPEPQPDEATDDQNDGGAA